MSAVDDGVVRAAEKLAQLSEAAARAGGVRARLAEPLADDAAFLRKLQPTLIAKRARGEAPTDGRPGPVEAPRATPERKPAREHRAARGGPGPLLVVAGAFAFGMALAHLVAWLGHRHPRD